MESGGMTARRRRRNHDQDRVELQFLEGVRRRVGDDPAVLKAVGDLYTRTGRHDEGLAADMKLAALCPDDPLVWYNLGCSLALLGRADESLDALKRAVALGYKDAEWMRSDSDLKSLRGDQRFQSLLRQVSP
jgi:predicted Zn-dependent protease